MKCFIFRLFILCLICLINTQAIARFKSPVAFILSSHGKNFYSTDGSNWEKIDRRTFVFPGQTIKTGPNGNCKIIFESFKYTKYIEKNSHVIIENDDIKVLSGNVKNQEKVFNILENIKRKFLCVQRYVSVPRSLKINKNIFNLPVSLVVCDNYPNLVWENCGPDYSYKLTIDKNIYDIQKSKQSIIKFKLKNIKPGEHSYQVEVMHNSTLYQKAKSKFYWLSEEEYKPILSKEKNLQLIDDKGFLLGNYLDDKGLKVAALDYYLNFFSLEYDNNLVPFIAKVYKELGLINILKQEVQKYNERLEEK